MYLRVPQGDEEYEYEEEEEEEDGGEAGEGLLVQLPLEDIARARMGMTESRSHHKKSKKSKKKHHRHTASAPTPAAPFTDDLLRATGLDDISDEEFEESCVHGASHNFGNFSLYDKAPNPGKKFPHAKLESPSHSLKVEIDLNKLSLGKRMLPGKPLPGKRQSLSSSEQELTKPPDLTSLSYHATPSPLKQTPPSYEPLPLSSSSEKKKKKKKQKHRHSRHLETPRPPVKEEEPMEEELMGSASPLGLSFDDSFSSSKSFNEISCTSRPNEVASLSVPAQPAPAPSVAAAVENQLSGYV